MIDSGWRNALELTDYVRALIGVRADRAALELRRKTIRLSLATAAGVAALTVVIASSVRIVEGLAGGFTALYRGRAWLGDLTTGLLLIALLAGGAYAFVARWDRKELEKHEVKYDRLRTEHRDRHGRHAADEEAPDPGGAPRR